MLSLATLRMDEIKHPLTGLMELTEATGILQFEVCDGMFCNAKGRGHWIRSRQNMESGLAQSYQITPNLANVGDYQRLNSGPLSWFLFLG
jgi:hypothetical protein